MPTTYPPLSTGAARRLALFKNEAARESWVRPMTWRDVRFATLKSETGLFKGFNGTGPGRVPVWYTFGRELRRERDAHEVLKMDHTGWYTDQYQDELAIGIITYLPHGRIIAGYRWTGNNEHIYFADIHDDEREAARAADEHARVFAEAEREYRERDAAAQELEDKLESSLQRLRECMILRHHRCMEHAKGEARELVAKIRQMREELRTDYADVR